MGVRVVGQKCSGRDLKRATSDLSGMAPGEVAAIKRSDGSWCYAMLLQRTQNDNKTSLKFVVDKELSTKEFPVAWWDQVKALGPGKAATHAPANATAKVS